MARIVVSVCDKCGLILAPDDPGAEIKVMLPNSRRAEASWHLCFKCRDDIWDWLANGGRGTPGPYGPNAVDEQRQREGA